MMKLESTTEALERLAIKQGAMLGNMSRPDQLLVLALAARCVPRSTALTEPAVNAALKKWLAGTGAMLSIDHVELRRMLVDAGLWQRDGFGHAYERPTSIATADVADAADALVTLDAERIVAAARTRRDAERAARKARAIAG
jgi:hypothetical protein